MAFEKLKRLFSKESAGKKDAKEEKPEKPDNLEAALFISKIEELSARFGEGPLDVHKADDYARGMEAIGNMPLSPTQAERAMKMHLEVMAKLRGSNQLNEFVSGLRTRERFQILPEAIEKIGRMRR